jgi:hypothetical protein
MKIIHSLTLLTLSAISSCVFALPHRVTAAEPSMGSSSQSSGKLTEENVSHIMRERDDAKKELEILISTTLEQMWMKELLNLESEYSVYKKKRENIQSGEKSTVSIKKKVKIVK